MLKCAKIVDRFSAVIDDSRELATDIAANHTEMSKFESSEDPGFKSIVSTLKRWERMTVDHSASSRMGV